MLSKQNCVLYCFFLNGFTTTSIQGWNNNLISTLKLQLYLNLVSTTFQHCINVEPTTLFQPHFNVETTTIFQGWCVTVVSTLIQCCCASWDSSLLFILLTLLNVQKGLSSKHLKYENRDLNSYRTALYDLFKAKQRITICKVLHCIELKWDLAWCYVWYFR